MTYKGSDLDLRTPNPRPVREAGAPLEELQLSSLASGRARAGNGAPEYLAVDDAVLAACNIAHDAATFLGSGEVGPVHLVHGLTRVEAAAAVLQRLGVDLARLRRASAAAVAAEAPQATGAAFAAARSTPDLVGLLRQAVAFSAAQAGAQEPQASVTDVLRAVLWTGREQTAAALLLEAAAEPDALWRWAMQAPTDMPNPAAQTAAVERLTERVGELEAAVRLLTEEFGRALAELTQRFESMRALAPREDNELPARLTALESTVAAQPSRIADAVALTLMQRSESEQASHAANGVDAAEAITQRFAGIEDLIRAQGERLEDAVRTQERDFQEIFEALVKLGSNQQTLANNLEAWRLDSSGDISIVNNRVEAMERSLRAVLPRPRPPQPASEQVMASVSGDDGQSRSFRRWLTTSGRMLPASWREDMNALRETLRPRRRNGET